MTEPPIEYRPIADHPAYRVGSDGTVWTCRKRGGRREIVPGAWRVMKPKPHKSGHLQVKLDGRFHFVHKLVLEAFVGPRPPGAQARHAPDRNPANNHAANLRWGTPGDNAADRDADGMTVRGENQHSAKLCEVAVRHIRSERGRTSQYVLAGMYGVSQGTISAVQLRKIWASVADSPQAGVA